MDQLFQKFYGGIIHQSLPSIVSALGRVICVSCKISYTSNLVTETETLQIVHVYFICKIAVCAQF